MLRVDFFIKIKQLEGQSLTSRRDMNGVWAFQKVLRAQQCLSAIIASSK